MQCPGHMAATAITACGRGLLARLTLADAAASHAALAAVQRRSHAATVLAARYRAHAASSALAEARWATDTVAHGWRRFKIRDWTQIGKTVRYDGPSRPVEHGPLTGVWIERFTHGTVLEREEMQTERGEFYVIARVRVPGLPHPTALLTVDSRQLSRPDMPFTPSTPHKAEICPPAPPTPPSLADSTHTGPAPQSQPDPPATPPPMLRVDAPAFEPSSPSIIADEAMVLMRRLCNCGAVYSTPLNLLQALVGALVQVAAQQSHPPPFPDRHPPQPSAPLLPYALQEPSPPPTQLQLRVPLLPPQPPPRRAQPPLAPPAPSTVLQQLPPGPMQQLHVPRHSPEAQGGEAPSRNPALSRCPLGLQPLSLPPLPSALMQPQPPLPEQRTRCLPQERRTARNRAAHSRRARRRTRAAARGHDPPRRHNHVAEQRGEMLDIPLPPRSAQRECRRQALHVPRASAVRRLSFG